MGTLFVVATPIGNLSDITYRAVETLKEVDHIFCENTLRAKRLLTNYDINTSLSSYTSWSGSFKINKAINMLKDGKSIALISDAGTPCISDPGVKLVRAVYEEFGSDADVKTIPGASAVIAALSASGAPASSFEFLGFLPKKHGRGKLLDKIGGSSHTVALYESPHRLLKTLKELSERLASEREVIVARELTKIYESFTKGTVSEVLEHFENNQQEIKGECIIIVSSLNRRK